MQTLRFNEIYNILKNLGVQSSDILQIPENIQKGIVNFIFYEGQIVAQPQDIRRYFSIEELPGTCAIGERINNPEIFQDTSASPRLEYNIWIYKSIKQTLLRIRDAGVIPDDIILDDFFINNIIEKTIQILEFKTDNGAIFRDIIPQQMYEDIFIRILSLLLGIDALKKNIYYYYSFNRAGYQIALSILEKLHQINDKGTKNIYKLVQLSVLSGYIGINIKSSASAASTLLNRNLLPLNESSIKAINNGSLVPVNEINSIINTLFDLCEKEEGKFGIDSTTEYCKEVINTNSPTLLIFFADDYLESIIDLKRFELILGSNPNLTVLFVPRSGRYGNDIAYEDVQVLIKENILSNLQILVEEKRLFITPNGPKAGCIDPRYISYDLIKEFDELGKNKKVIFETKGCRNFEMLKGKLKYPWYAGFNCNRALSIRTVGIDGNPVFFRIPPGLLAYDGFNKPKIGHSSLFITGDIKFCKMTSTDLYRALDSLYYKEMLKKSQDEYSLNSSIMKICKKMNLTFSDYIEIQTEKSHQYISL